MSTTTTESPATTTNQRSIGLWSCVAFAVGSMVGAGVFVLSGLAVHDAGPAALVSFGIAGIGVLCSALSFMVIASQVRPGELGYAPVGRALGHRFWGFATSWSFYVSAIICTAFVLTAFGSYFHDFFLKGVSPLLWALIGAIIMTILNLGRANNISRIEDILVITKIAILVVFISFGISHFTTNTLVPFAPHGTSSVMMTSGLLFIAYLGFSAITNIAGDVKHPRRTIPRAILLSILIVIALYIGVVIALLALPLRSYNEASVGQAALVLMGPVGGILIPIAALISTLSAANSNILGASELMVRLAIRKDVPTIAGYLWNGRPIVSVLFGSVVYIALIASQQTTAVIALANVTAIAAIILVDIAAMKVLFRKPIDSLALPGGPLLPAIGLLSSVFELTQLGTGPIVIGLTFVVLGSLLYAGREYFHDSVYHERLVEEIRHYGGPAARALKRLEQREL